MNRDCTLYATRMMLWCTVRHCVKRSGCSIYLPRSTQLMISIPPKYSVADVVGFIKGKSAIHVARTYGGWKRNFVGQSFWARGYFASTVGRDEEVIRNYIRHQEAEDRRIDQLRLM